MTSIYQIIDYPIRSYIVNNRAPKYHNLNASFTTSAAYIDPEHLPFNNRDTYLAWRTQWRSAYNELTNLVQSLKSTARKHGHMNAQGEAQSRLVEAKKLANVMLLQRHYSKQKAQGDNYKPQKPIFIDDYPLNDGLPRTNANSVGEKLEFATATISEPQPLQANQPALARFLHRILGSTLVITALIGLGYILIKCVC